MSSTKFVVVKLQELIKTAIFAVLGVIILVGLIWFFLGLGKADSASDYKDGLYHSSFSVGDESVMVSVEIREGKISDIALSPLSDNAIVFLPLLQDVASEISGQIIENQKLEVDVNEDSAYSAKVILKAVEQSLITAKK